MSVSYEHLVSTALLFEPAALPDDQDPSMSMTPPGPKRFWNELKERKVFRVAAVYAVVGWVVFEVAEAVFPRLLLPDWSVTLVLVMILLGFPLALVLAWAFDLTPDGVRRAAEVHEETGPEGEGRGAPELLPSTLAGRVAAAGGALVLALTGGAFFVLQSPGPELVDDRVVVGIFENQTGDPGLDPVGRMASDVIGQGLTRAGVIEVVPTATAIQVARRVEEDGTGDGSADPLRLLAEETGAAHLVTGAYYLEGDSLRFQAQVVDGARSRVVAALEPARAHRTAPGEGLVELGARVAGVLAQRMDPRLADVANQISSPPSYEAYRAYTTGLDAFLLGEFRDALDHLDRALASDSTWVEPLILSAIAHVNLGEPARTEARLARIHGSPGSLTPFQAAQADVIRAWLDGDNRAAYRAATRAAELAPSGPLMYQSAYEALRLNRPREAVDRLLRMGPDRVDMEGWVPYWGQLTVAYHLLGEHRDELEATREGREQYPDRMPMLAYEARALAALGRVDEVRALVGESRTLPPDPSWEPARVWLEAGTELRAHGHPDAAREVLNEAVEWYRSRQVMEDGREAHRHRLGDALYHLGRYEEAREVFTILSDAHHEEVSYVGHLGMIAALAGDRAEARRFDERLAAWEESYLNGTGLLWRAYIAGALGERERAVELLRRALAEGAPYGVNFHRLPPLDSLRDYGPFQELMRPKG